MRRITAILLCLLLITGCGNKNEDGAEPTPSVGKPVTALPNEPVAQEGGTLRLAMRAPKTLNPLLNEDVTVDRVLQLIFEPLAMLDEQLQPNGHLADFNFSSDGASVTLSIREDAVWSDGVPVTADDIIFSIESLQNAPETAIYKHTIDNFASWTSVDSKTLKITFVEVCGGSGYLFTFPVIPKHYYKGETDPGSAKNMSPLGNGLFIFESYTNMKTMTLTRSIYTFRKRAYIEGVEVTVVPDAETDYNAFDQGLVDVYTTEITEWSKRHSVKEIRFAEYATTYYDFIGFNFNDTRLQPLAVRQAIAHAVDWDDMIAGIYLEHAARTTSPVNPASWLYEPDVAVYAYDTEKAKALLASLVIETQPDETADEGAADATEPADAADDETAEETIEATDAAAPLRILVNEENDERKKIAEKLADGMRAIGLDAELDVLPFDAYYEKLATGDFDLFIGGYNLSVIPDLRFAFHAGGIESGTNLLAYSDATLDRLLTTAFLSGTDNAYKKALSDVQKYMAEQLPVISLMFRKTALLTDMRIYGALNPSPGHVFANVNEWFIVD